jgi:inositol-hexakisphosphate kinase
MPDTLPRPEAAGPSFLVNHPPILEDKNVGISPSSPTGASSITATPIGVSIAQAKPQDFARPTRRASTFVEHSPVLSERESIFATNYTSVENDLPLLPPAGAATEPSSAPLVNSDMEFSSPPRLASTPNMLSIRPPSLTAARSGPNGIAGGLKQYAYTTSERPADKQLPASNGAIPGIRRVASDGHPWVRNSRTNDAHPTMFPGRDHPQEIPNGRAIEDDKAQLDTNAVERKDEAEQKLIQGAQRQSAMSQAMRPTRSERSASRGRTHVDKSIEATLANTEPGQNIRTRKSSHLMGVFRENATPLEPRPREASAPYTEEGYYTPTVSRPSRPSGQPSSRPTSIAAPEAISAQAASALQEDATPEWNQLYAPTPGQKRDSGLASNQVPATPKLPQSPPAQPKSPSKHDHDPYFRKQDAIKQSKGSQVPPVPVSLPEQTREHHNLVLMRGRSSTQDHSGFTGHEDTDFASRGRLRTGSIEGPPDENEEHISSAVYFPHPVPMEEIEQFNVPQRRPLIKGAAAEMGSSVPVATQTLNDVKWPSTDLAPPEHIDISVQSKHEKRVFHGDYQPPEDVQGEELDRDILPTIKERPVDSYAITSDSDIESGEDMGVTSQTDDGEITPTATPIVASQPRHGKRASLSSTGPKGAVLLEPYSHQVGGHSTIFRFSRRAVCKQLNNRENEFYERIERRHPEMLRFLPRFVLVLVTSTTIRLRSCSFLCQSSLGAPFLRILV